MLDLTVVSVESLLNTVHICSSQHATGNCSIYKPKEKKTKNNNNRITITTQTQEGQRTKKDLREFFVLENIFFSFIAGCTILKGKSESYFHISKHNFPFKSNAPNHTRWRRGPTAISHALLILLFLVGSIIKLYCYCLKRHYSVQP